MKYVYLCLAIFTVLFGTHTYIYKKGFENGVNKNKLEMQEIANSQQQAINAANRKILDLQRVISNNNDECFNRVWPDEIIDAVNPK